MRVRQHHSQHEAVEDLPLLTESATVTEVSTMDHNRSAEVIDELRRTLDEFGTGEWQRVRPDSEAERDAWLRDRLDPIDHLVGGTPFNRYLPESVRPGRVGGKVADLQARYLQPYPSLLRLTVETAEPIDFAPGQYLGLRYRDSTRVYSIASSPTRDEIEFCIRRVPGGKLTSELAVDLEVGETVTLRGPYGDFLLKDPSHQDVVFLATGTGVAPFKAMIDFVFESGRDTVEGERRDVWLILGAAWRDTMPYFETFERYDRERENFHFIPTLSREAHLTDWAGETAYVQDVLRKYVEDNSLDDWSTSEGVETGRHDVDARLNPDRMEVYACGLTAMVTDLVEAADRLGVPDEYTQFEGFG